MERLSEDLEYAKMTGPRTITRTLASSTSKFIMDVNQEIGQFMSTQLSEINLADNCFLEILLLQISGKKIHENCLKPYLVFAIQYQ